MLKITISLLLGGTIAVLSALLGLGANENYQRVGFVGTAVDYVAGEQRQQTRSSHNPGLEIQVLPAVEPRAVATVQFHNPEFGLVELNILDRESKRVRTLVRKYLASGTYRISWYGETDLRTQLAPGVFLAEIRTNDRQTMTKIVLPDLFY